MGEAEQKIIRPDFYDIKAFLERTVAEQGLFTFDCIVALYYGGAIPSVILKHCINRHKRMMGLAEINIYPMRIKTTRSDGVGANDPKCATTLEYFIEPKRTSSGMSVLLVDDIIAYGKTIHLAHSTLSSFFTRNGINAKVRDLSLIVNTERYFSQNERLPDGLVYYLETGDRDTK
jgi:hypoxanthine phosphoribosyltransferase